MIGSTSRTRAPDAPPPQRPPISAAGAAVLLVVSVLVAIGLGEAALRLLYRDAGRTTLGGPGNRHFYYETTQGQLRGRRDIGPKQPGVPRIMVVGDSITFGQGVRDWRDTWPELLAQQLERAGRPHELAVFAAPGTDIPQHVDTVREWCDRVAPDVFIYQWYVNDIEAISHRPDVTRAWQHWRWHQTLRTSSYLYFLIDHRLSQLLPPPERSYVDYLLTDFTPGTLEWTEFEREFHELALRAGPVSTQRVLVLYPQVPFRGRYPLQAIHDRMRLLAQKHYLEIPPAALMRSSGTLAPQAAAPWKQVIALSAASAVVETLDYVFSAGPLAVELALQRVPSTSADDMTATLELVDAATDRVVQATGIHTAAGSQVLSWVSLPLTVAGEGLQRLRLRLRFSGHGEWALADLRVPVNYAFEVVDLTEPLNAIQSHASSFDAHPNEAAHQVIADQVYRALMPH